MRGLMSLAGCLVFFVCFGIASAWIAGGCGPASPRLVAEGFCDPVGLGFDARGGLYVAEARGRVLHVLSDGERCVLAEGLGRLGGLAVDRRGRVCVSRPDRGEILALGARGGREVLARGLASPRGLCAARRGGLLVAETGADRVLLVDGEGAPRVALSPVRAPVGVAETSGGVAACGRDGLLHGELRRCPGRDGLLLASSPAGGAWVLDREAGLAFRLPGTGPGPALPEGLGAVAALACDRDGGLFAAARDGRVWRIAWNGRRPSGSGARPVAACPPAVRGS